MKAIGWLVGIIVLIVVAIIVYVVLNSGNLLKTAVETLGPRYLGVDVQLDAAEISFTEGTGELRGLTIGNPEDFAGPHSFSLGRIKLGLDPMAQSESLVVLKTIEVDAADLAIIARGTSTNLQAIMANLDSSEEPPADEAAAGPKLIIDSFAFTNARTSLDSDLLGASSVDIPDIFLTDIGRKSQGVTIREALKQLFRPIVRASTEAIAAEQLNVDQLKQEAEQRLDDEVNERLGTGLGGLKDRLNN